MANKRIEIPDDTYNKLKALGIVSGKYINKTYSVTQMIQRLTRYEWENPSFQDDDNLVSESREIFKQLSQKK